MLYTADPQTHKTEVSVYNAALFSLDVRLKGLPPDISIFIISPLKGKTELPGLDAHTACIEQPAEPGEDEEAYWESSIDNFSCYIDFIAYCLKHKTKPVFVYLKDEDIANTYALGYLLIVGVKENEALAFLLKQNPRLEFNYYTACLLDQLLVREGRLLEAVEDYETTGIVVSSTGMTFTKES